MQRIVGPNTLGLFLALSLGWATPTQASEVAKFEVEFFENGSSKAMNYATVWVSGRRIRVEQRTTPEGEIAPVLIYRGDLGRFYSIDERAKNYSEVARKQITKMSNDVKRARVAVEQQLQALPSDQRKAFQRLLGVAGVDPQTTRKTVVVTSDDVNERVSGLDCTRATMARDGDQIGKTCVTPWEKLGITQSDAEVFRTLANFKREVLAARGLTPLELVPNQPLDLLVQFDGFPLYYRRTVNGQPRSAIEVRSLTMLSPNETLFEVPEGYALREGLRDFVSQLDPGTSRPSPAAPANPKMP